VPATVAAAARSALAGGVDVSVSLGAPGWSANARRARVAPFSSHGLAFGGGIKPEVAAAGVELVTSDPGRNEDRTARYGSISGTSASAAFVGGAAAVLAQMRPGLDAFALKGALVGTAVRISGGAPAAQGAGMVDAAAASAAEAVSEPVAISFGAADKAGWKAVRRIAIRNISSRRIDVDVIAESEGIAGVSVTADPPRVRIRPGQRQKVKLTAHVSFLPRGLAAIEGRARLVVAGGGHVVVPWAVALPTGRAPLLTGVRLSVRSFRASDRAPAVLTVRAGQVQDLAGRRQLRPLSRLDVQLWHDGKPVGLLARLRDVLPGRYAFGLTGRGPRGGPLARGEYSLRVLAVPPFGKSERVAVSFRIR
jgi:hypothetical protein